ncbi:MAG: molybdopterin molybdotransferase MoeA [Chthoniobacteraceae bacterium]
MISLEEARRMIAEAIQPRASEQLSLADARGCVLAEDVKADAAYPSADRSMMDGYAIGDDDAHEFRVTGEVRTGAVPGFVIGRGECARIFTGAELPAGAAFVIPQEDVERVGEVIKVPRRPAKTCIRRRGVEAQPGDVVLVRGSRLGAADLAILAQVGVTRVPVHPPARVAHIATGDELIAPDGALAAGQTRDTNSTLIAALVAECGGRIARQDRCGDDPQKLGEWARTAKGDVLLISGGASVGDYDFGARMLRDAGFTIHFDKVNLRPGKPLTFATRGAHAAFVIPGNPVSHFVCFHVAIRLALELVQGAQPLWETVLVELGGEQALRGDARETWWPACVAVRESRLVAEPRRWTSSGDTFSLAGTNALLRVTGDVMPGAQVPVLLLDVPRG